MSNREPVARELMAELAYSDAQVPRVDSALYGRSATYQQTLDTLLGARRMLVSRLGGRLAAVRPMANRPSYGEVSDS